MTGQGQARKAERKTDRLADAAQFFKSWAEKPLQLGSVTPSSRFLSDTMARHVDPKADGPVIEIGPGTGPITAALIRRGVPEKNLVLVEYSAEFCDLLKARYPAATVLQGDGYALTSTLGNALTGKATAIICGLPLLTKPEPVRLDLLGQAFEIMRPSAPFVQFTYGLVSPIPLKNASFRWDAPQTVWRNVPPARVWVYRPPLKN